MKIKRRPTPAPHIPFISLADIAWQIIIFFFMASSFTKTDAMKVDTPSASNKAAAEQQDEKTFTIVATNEAYEIDKRRYSLDELSQEIATHVKTAKKPSDRFVIIDGNKNLSWQRNVALTYAIQKAGGVPMIPDDSDDN